MEFAPKHEIYKRRFGRNLGVGLVLATFVALVLGLSVVKVRAIAAVDGFSGAVVVVPEPEAKTP